MSAVRCAAIAVLLACRHPPVEAEQRPTVTIHLVDAAIAADPSAQAPSTPPPIAVDYEVTARIVDAKHDKAAGTTFVTIAAGANEGVRADWIGTIVDDSGTALGTIVLVEIKPRTTKAATPLPPDQLEGKRVRLATPPR